MKENNQEKLENLPEYQKVYLEEKAKLDAKKEFENQKKKETKEIFINFLRYILSIFLIIIGFLSFLGCFITPDINIVQMVITSLLMVVIGILELPPIIKRIGVKTQNNIIRKYTVLFLIIVFLIAIMIG